MLLAHVRLVDVGPFEDTTFPFASPSQLPRLATVVVGGGGVGKTSLLAAIASTRPGHTLPQSRPWASASGNSASGSGTNASDAPVAVGEWALDDDDPSRPHLLRVASPNATLEDERDDEALLRRREQTLFD